MKNKKGLFVSFEGLDGSGKTSIINIIQEKIKKTFLDLNLMLVREPGGTKVGEQIRKVLLSPNNEIEPITEVFLFAASRAELFSKNSPVINHLNNGNLLLSDRFIDSSIVYQGAQGIDRKLIKEINEKATNNLCPDYTFFLMIPPKLILERTNKKSKNRLDHFAIKFQQKIFDFYKERIKEIELGLTKQKAIEIDASQPLKNVAEDVWKKIKSIIEKHYYT